MVVLSVAVDIVAAEDEARFRDLMEAHHYLGAVPGMGETVRYVAHHRGRWLALLVFSAPALKCGARDRWIGWDRGVQFGRLHLVTNNSRFLILPGGPRNLGSRVLSLCARRLVRDWPARFGHEVLLAETFVDPAQFRGTVYRAANWIEVGRTRGFARDGHGYSEHARPKLVFLHPLSRGAQARLRAAHLDPRLRHGVPKMTLSAAQMRSLPEFFQGIDDPRRRQGRRHALPTVLALATAATLCQGFDDLKELGDRPRPAMGDDQWQWRGAAALFMDEMDIGAIDRGGEVGEAVDCGLLLPPIELVDPIRTELLHVIEIGTVSPTAVVGHLVPGIVGDAGTDAIESFVRNVEVERSDGCHILIKYFRLLVEPMPLFHVVQLLCVHHTDRKCIFRLVFVFNSIENSPAGPPATGFAS